MSEEIDYDGVLRAHLAGARLPSLLEDIIGHRFQFRCQFGSHHTILAGTITGLGISDEGGLDLYVSTPRFHGMPLISLKWNGDDESWSAFVDNTEPSERFFEGEFGLLAS